MEGLFNRRYLRVKVMQAVYAYDSANHDIELGEKSLVKSLDDVYTLYVQMISLLLEVVDMSRKSIELKKEKRLVTEEDLNPNLRFAENRAALTIENNRKYKLYAEKINWNVESDNIKKVWKEVEADKKYKAFMSNPRHNFQHEVEIMIYIFKNYIAVNELFLDLFEERSIYWYDDVQMVSINVVKTLSSLRPEMDEFDSILMQLFKNQQEDLKFVKELYHKTILQSDSSMKLIEKYTKNWDVDRIARLDTVLMKISITEFTSFPGIPVKVSMNEYLEISKSYSTEKSRVFINGVLDKILIDLKNDDKLNKSGMGLINR
jgi:N utilization substance protein B